MKKTVLLVLMLALSLVFSLSACNSDDGEVVYPDSETQTENGAPQIPPDGEQIFYREHGKIEKIIMYHDGKALWIREYDEKGVFTRYTEYTESGFFIEDKLSGNRTSKASYYDEEGELCESISYEYYESSAIKKETLCASDGSVKGVFEYDESGANTRSYLYELFDRGYILCEIVDHLYGDLNKDVFYRSDGSILSVREHDENGNITKNTHYAADGTMSSYTLYEYSAELKMICETTYGATENIISVCRYSESGHRTLLENYNANGSLALSYVYGENGSIARVSRYGDHGELSSLEEYGENGELICYTEYNGDGSRLIYDGNYNIVEGIRYLRYANGGFTKYEYANGLIKTEAVSYDGLSISSLTKYDDNALPSEVCTFKGGALKDRTVYLRDENGNITGYSKQESNGTSLVYDADGNIVSGVRYSYYKGALHTKYEYESGITVKESIYSDGKIALTVEYDENETMRKESFYTPSGTLSRVREYDANGVLRKDSVYNSQGKLSSVTRYDEKGNEI